LAAKRMWENGSLSVPERLAAVWLLYSVGEMPAGDLIRLSREGNEHLRSWAVRLLGDGLLDLNLASVKRLKELAANDPSGLVRMYIASGLDRLKPTDALEIASLLVGHEQDAEDRVQPHLIWYRIEPLLVHNLDAAISLARNSRMALVRQNVARRLAAAIENHPDAIERLLQRSVSDPLPVRRDVLSGIAQGLEGWSEAIRPSSWNSFAATFNEETGLTEVERAADVGLVDELNHVFGDGRSPEALLKIALDRSVSVSARKQAIVSLGKSSDVGEEFLKLAPLLRQRELAVDLLKTMAKFDSPRVPDVILASFKKLRTDAKSAAFDTLTARPQWARQLLEMIGTGKVDRSFFTAWHARQVISFEEKELNDLLANVWGAVRQTSMEREAETATLMNVLTEERLNQANLENGQKVFSQVCASCHRMFGKGAQIGPDLTGANRSNLTYLLENILDPSATLATTYRSSLILLDDGRLISGVVVEETDRIVGVQTKDEIVKIDKKTIEERKQSDQSLMPEGLLTPLSETQKVDLIAWLSKAGE
jgi:putative heme-binding domain-containing protein